MNVPLLLSIFLLSFLSSAVAAADLSAWFVPSALKVMREAKAPADAPQKWELASARNEVEACQLVLLAEKPVQAVEVSVSGLKSKLGSLKASIFKVDYVPIPRENVQYPDPLPPLSGPIDLEPGQAQPIWISVRVPAAAAPGRYTGTVTVKAAGGTKQFPLSIHVWDFALPVTPSSQSAFGIDYNMMADFEGVKLDTPEGRALANRYWDCLLDHRLSPMFLPVDPWSDDADRYLDDARLTSFFVCRTTGKTDEELRKIIDRLIDNGVFTKSYFYDVDEPIKKESFDALVAYTDRLRSIEPRYRVVTPFWGNPDWDKSIRTKDAMLGRVNIWCPHYDYVNNEPGFRDFLKKRRNAGDDIWWYVCNNPRPPFNNMQIDDPGMSTRTLLWQQKREGIDGLLYWHVNCWNRQYIDDPWTNQDTLGDRHYGDGSLIYPGKKVGVDGPVSSVRLEILQDSLEDFDYLTLADERLGPEVTRSFVARVARAHADWEKDPMKLESVRRELGKALERATKEARKKL